jgi:deoxyribonuclease IV
MLLGAHVPTGGRLPRAIDAALERGCRSLQVFASNPRGWAPPNHSREDLRAFAERRAEAGLGPAFVHSSYLVNIASPDPGFLTRSVDLARREMAAAAAMGAEGLVVHAGAGGPGERGPALERAAASARAIAAEGPEVLLELTAGGAGTIASTISQARELLDACGGHPRIGIVVDTCHLFAAGAPLDTAEGVAETFEELRHLRLVGRLRLIHANDAEDPRGSRRDRHAHIGEGRIGDEGFRAILSQPVVRGLPVIVETPGRSEEDRRNLGRLRALAGPVGGA